MQLRGDFAVKHVWWKFADPPSSGKQLDRPKICRETFFATNFASAKLEFQDNFRSAGVLPWLWQSPWNTLFSNGKFTGWISPQIATYYCDSELLRRIIFSTAVLRVRNQQKLFRKTCSEELFHSGWIFIGWIVLLCVKTLDDPVIRNANRFTRIASQKNTYFHDVRAIRANRLKPAIRGS